MPTSDQTPENISTLLQSVKDQRRMSFADMQKLTGIPRATLGWYVKADDFFPIGLDNLERIASGLGIPLARVKRAAIQSAGYSTDRATLIDSRLQALSEYIGELSDEDYSAVESMIIRLAGGRG